MYGDVEDDGDHPRPLQVQQRRASNARPGCANFCSSRTDALPWFVLCLALSLFSITFIKMIFEKWIFTFQSALSATIAVTERRIMEKLKGSQNCLSAMVSSLKTFERLKLCKLLTCDMINNLVNIRFCKSRWECGPLWKGGLLWNAQGIFYHVRPRCYLDKTYFCLH